MILSNWAKTLTWIKHSKWKKIFIQNTWLNIWETQFLLQLKLSSLCNPIKTFNHFPIKIYLIPVHHFKTPNKIEATIFLLKWLFIKSWAKNKLTWFKIINLIIFHLHKEPASLKLMNHFNKYLTEKIQFH